MAVNLGTLYASLQLQTGQFNQQINQSLTRFQRLGQGLERIGQSMTRNLTLPIVGAGAAALTTATRMDSLKRGLTAVAGSSEEMNRQLVRLKEVAKLPGLGMEEAIQGSIRLQAAGFSAEQAEAALKGFGNAIATVGGGKAELEGVALALAQIAAKGKVTAEEINQIAERVPQVRQVMKEAFGTASTEELQKMGITASQFIDKVNERLGRMKQVTGGAQNAMENLEDSGKRALTAIGDTLLPHASRAAEVLAAKLEEVAEKWKAMPRDTQNAVVGIAALVASLGLAISLAAKLTTAIATLRASAATPIVLKIAATVAITYAVKKGIDSLMSPIFAGFDAENRVAGLPASQALTARLAKIQQLERQRDTLPAGSPQRRAIEAEIQNRYNAANRLLPPSKLAGTGVAGIGGAGGLEIRPLMTGGGIGVDSDKAKRDSEHRADRLRAMREEVIRLTKGQFAGERFAAETQFMEDTKTVGAKKASELYQKTLQDIAKREKEAREKLFQERMRETSRFNLETLRMEDEFAARRKEAEARRNQSSREGVLPKAEIKRRYELDLADIAADQAKALEEAEDKTWKEFLKKAESGRKWVQYFAAIGKGLEQAAKNKTALQSRLSAGMTALFGELNAYAQQLGETFTQSAGSVANQPLKDFADQIRQGLDAHADMLGGILPKNSIRETFNFGAELGKNLADSFASSFGEELERIFGRGNPIARALSRTLEDYFHSIMSSSLSGLFGTTIAGTGMAQQGKQKKFGGLLGGILGSVFSPLGGVLGGLFGGVLGFDSGANDATARRWGFDFGRQFTRGMGDYTSRVTPVSPNRMAAAGAGASTVNVTLYLSDVKVGDSMDIDRLSSELAWRTGLKLRARPGS